MVTLYLVGNSLLIFHMQTVSCVGLTPNIITDIVLRIVYTFIITDS